MRGEREAKSKHRLLRLSFSSAGASTSVHVEEVTHSSSERPTRLHSRLHTSLNDLSASTDRGKSRPTLASQSGDLVGERGVEGRNV